MAKTNQARRNGHGGVRPNSGRKPGFITRKTREILNQAAASGLLPEVVMLENMRAFYAAALDAEKVDGAPLATDLRMKAQECAKDAAPYIHPRLAAVKLIPTNPNDDARKQLTDASNGLDDLISPFKGVNKSPPVINGTTNGKGETH